MQLNFKVCYENFYVSLACFFLIKLQLSSLTLTTVACLKSAHPRLSVRLSVRLSAVQQSKTNYPKVLKLGKENDLGIP